MSRPDAERTDAVRDEADESPSEQASDWSRRHARVDPPATDDCVRAESPDDDWQSRHGRTARRD